MAEGVHLTARGNLEGEGRVTAGRQKAHPLYIHHPGLGAIGGYACVEGEHQRAGGEITRFLTYERSLSFVIDKQSYLESDVRRCVIHPGR